MKPPLACKNCRARKKKCDRAYPVCSYCLRMRNRCEYRIDGHPDRPTRPVVALVPPANGTDGTQRVRYNAAMFLGYPRQSLPRPPAWPSTAVGPEVLDYVFGSGIEERRWLIAEFIRTVDPWVPFIPLQELQTRLLGEKGQMAGEDVLLLACIRLNTEPVPGGQPVNRAYLAVKSNFVSAEIYWTLSIRLLQALLLLLIYEHGHGVYPSAYTTLGSCARYLAALDINTGSEQEYSRDWMSGEVRRRLWWFVYVMDRSPARMRCSLSDDLSWKQEHPLQCSYLTLLSPASSNMGTFRLLVHAAFLVGRVVQLLSDRHAGHEVLPSRRTQLYRTIKALANVLEVELQTTLVSVSVARSTLNSAIFMLYSYDDPRDAEYRNVYDLAHPMSISAHTCRDLTEIYLSGDLTSAQRASPFLLAWGFRVLKYFYDRYQLDGHHESLEALNIMRKGMEALGNKWKLAEVYAVLLNVEQGCPAPDDAITAELTKS
ncbi:fungal-specific transcription factor domain-containing protein [Penicillium chermesinum]|uniref:Fungal-specific transcription factor domain-containing protein n=1 Tax=Penicillium chermesinum TaxID=63820 RepID=A0A9W9P644_9EURO|nr:fungal-specific transcription factor domain-containing protein [Penicillium chermesinum]KAJ5238517.1 fungal-specific transcription factor domain-containing protein [Penicillium chermesinum]